MDQQQLQSIILDMMGGGTSSLPDGPIALMDISAFFNPIIQQSFDHYPDADEARDILNFFPSDIFPASILELLVIDDIVFFPKDAGDPSIPYFFSFKINLATKLNIIPDIIQLEDCNITVVIFGGEILAEVSGVFDIEGYQFRVTTALPSMLIEAKLLTNLDDQANLSPLEVLKKYDVAPFESSASSIELDDFLLLASPRSSYMVLHLGLSAVPIFNNFSLPKMQAEVAYSQGNVTGFFKGVFQLAIATKAPILIPISVSHEDPTDGWQLEGGIAPGDYNFLELFNALVSQFAGDTTLPDALTGKDIQLNYIYLSFNTATQVFSFDCSLDFHGFFGIDKAGGYR